MVICCPFLEVICDVVCGWVRTRIFEIDYDDLLKIFNVRKNVKGENSSVYLAMFVNTPTPIFEP